MQRHPSDVVRFTARLQNSKHPGVLSKDLSQITFSCHAKNKSQLIRILLKRGCTIKLCRPLLL